MKLLTIIPAKLDSKRLTKKNIRELKGKPLFLHSIDYAQDTKHKNKIIVSSESKEVEDLVPEDIFFHRRSEDLCGDVEVVDVYLDIIKDINTEFDYVICLQPDNPNRSNTLDECLDYLIDIYYDVFIRVFNEYKLSVAESLFKNEFLYGGLVF